MRHMVCWSMCRLFTVDRRARGARRAWHFSAVFAISAVIVVAAPAPAQDAARFAVDSVLSIDAFGGENVSNRPQLIIDITAGARLSDQIQLYIRPWFRL